MCLNLTRNGIPNRRSRRPGVLLIVPSLSLVFKESKPKQHNGREAADRVQKHKPGEKTPRLRKQPCHSPAASSQSWYQTPTGFYFIICPTRVPPLGYNEVKINRQGHTGIFKTSKPTTRYYCLPDSDVRVKFRLRPWLLSPSMVWTLLSHLPFYHCIPAPCSLCCPSATPRTGGGSDSCCLLLPLPGTPSLAFLCGLVCVNCLGLSSNFISSVRSSLASLANAGFHLLLSYSLSAKYPDLSSYYDYLSLEIILYIHSLLVVCLSLM